MFELVKQKVSLLSELEKDLSVTFRQIGDKNWAIDADKNVEGCPFCGHHDCFRVCQVEGEEESSFFKCFSCGEHGDVISWRSKRKNITIGEAFAELAKENNIALPREQSPIQQIFNLATNYYHNCLVDSCNRPIPILNGLTPLQYQTTVRKHKEATLIKSKVGFSDGGLRDYLEAVGIDPELIKDSGLLNKKGRDLFPSNTFIYPHFVKGRPSHFTFKDPTKRLAYQLPGKYSLNGWLFYGQDSFDKSDIITLVEGENDKLSVDESGCSPCTLAVIGQISADQLAWLRDNCKTKRLITVFDPDAAGDKYRKTLEKHRKFFGGLVHVLPPDGKDIDRHLADGADYQDLVRNNLVEVKLEESEKVIASRAIDWASLVPSEGPVNKATPAKIPAGDITLPAAEIKAPSASINPFEEQGVDPEPAPITVENKTTEVAKYIPPTELSAPSLESHEPGEIEVDEDGEAEVFIDDSPIYQAKGCYWKTRFDKHGEPKPQRISDFVLVLKNIYIKEGIEDEDRHREVVIRRKDGLVSDPFLIDSETKVGSKLFKVIVAKKADCEWTGMDGDLVGVWRLVYQKAPDRSIRIPRQTGRYPKLNSWVFKNVLITGSGVSVQADDDGVFWVQGKHLGIKPQGLSHQATNEDADGIPKLDTSLTREETKKLLGEAVHQLYKNLGNKGSALLALGWIYSNAYSDLLFKINNGMSILLFWGVYGEGKSTVGKWLLNFYGMADHGSITVALLKSAVGFLRKAEYYGSLPMMIDEVRNDEISKSYMGMFRAWYDRDGRSIASRDGFGVINQKIRSNLILAGEDLPVDPATKERCVSIRVLKNGRETTHSYKWFQDNNELLSNIGYYWILDSCNVNLQELTSGVKEVDKILSAAGCSKRISKNWSAAGYFGNKLAQEYMPDFDFLGYLAEEGAKEQHMQRNESTLLKFFESVEAMQAQDNPKISGTHIAVEDNLLHLWFAAVFKAVNDDNRGKDSWSKMAILRALKEESYYVADDRKVMLGFNGVRRTVVTLDLSKAPDVFKTIASSIVGHNI